MRKKTKRTLGLATILACSLSLTAFGATVPVGSTGTAGGECHCGLYGCQHYAVAYRENSGSGTIGLAAMDIKYSGHHGEIYCQIGDVYTSPSKTGTGPASIGTARHYVDGHYKVTEIHSYSPY